MTTAELPRPVDSVAPTGAAAPYDAVIFGLGAVLTASTIRPDGGHMFRGTVDLVRLTASPGGAGSGVRVEVAGSTRVLRPGDAARFPLEDHSTA